MITSIFYFVVLVMAVNCECITC